MLFSEFLRGAAPKPLVKCPPAEFVLVFSFEILK